MRKRYWLRGGVIGFVISLLPSLVIIFYNCNVLSFFSDYPGEGSFCSWLYHARVPFVPFLPSTFRLINKDNIKFIKPGAILVNTARGEIIETEALVLALMNGPLAGVGMDVLEGEGDIKDETAFLYYGHPKEQELKSFLANHVLMKMDNVLITPHTAFNTKEAIIRILDTTIENIEGFTGGKLINLTPEIK